MTESVKRRVAGTNPVLAVQCKFKNTL